jgi:hypothetical protein
LSTLSDISYKQHIIGHERTVRKGIRWQGPGFRAQYGIEAGSGERAKTYGRFPHDIFCSIIIKLMWEDLNYLSSAHYSFEQLGRPASSLPAPSARAAGVTETPFRHRTV